MRQISSDLTWLYKKVFPVVMFAVLAIAFVAGAISVARQQAPPGLLLIPAGMALLFYVILSWLIFPLMDEVWFDGDELVLRNRGEEERVSIANVINVVGQRWVNPERVVLTLRDPCAFGISIAFLPTFRWWNFLPHPIVDELVRRSYG